MTSEETGSNEWGDDGSPADDEQARARWVEQCFDGERGEFEGLTIQLTPDAPIGDVFALVANNEHDSIHVAGLLTVDEDFYREFDVWFAENGFMPLDVSAPCPEWSEEALLPDDDENVTVDSSIPDLGDEFGDQPYTRQVVLQSREGPTVGGVIEVLGAVRHFSASEGWFRRPAPIAPVYGMISRQKFKPAGSYTPIAAWNAPPGAPRRAIDAFDAGLANGSPWNGAQIVAADAASIDPVFEANGQIAWPDGGHGTFCAGVSRQRDPNALVRVHRIVGAKGLISELVVKARLEALAANPPGRVDLVVMPFGGYPTTAPGFKLLEAAIRQFLASRPGAVIVAAAGNESTASPSYPAAFAAQIGRVVSAGASTMAGGLAAFSNYGPSVNAYARGVGINSCFVTGRDTSGQVFAGYARGAGTSFASARAAGALTAASLAAGSTVAQAWAKLLANAGGNPVYFN